MLKATGMVRRIDELGRIVVPKELRNTLRIKDGTVMEIFTSDRDELVLKKYSPVGDISEFCESLCQALRQVYPVTAIICGTESVLAVKGKAADEIEKSLKRDLVSLMEKRQQVIIQSDFDNYLSCKRNVSNMLVSPIIVKGDLYGAVVFLTFDGQEITPQTVKAADMTVALIQQQYS